VETGQISTTSARVRRYFLPLLLLLRVEYREGETSSVDIFRVE
jgi:hypothetical protein